MRRPASRRRCARACVLFAAAVIVGACVPSGPLTQRAPPAPEVPPTARPEPTPPPPSAAHPAPTWPEAAPRPPAGATCPEVDEYFRGHYRAGAKTEFVLRNGTLARVESFPDLGALRAFLRPQIDQLMRYRHPHLSAAGAGPAGRVPEEQHNVAVDAYIHAVKHEAGPRGDGDFHIMLGSSATPGDGIFMTAEASGLPAGGAHQPLFAAARRQLLTILGKCRWGSGFMKVAPPIRVRVSGSLLFDSAHAIGGVGPDYAKPFTVWEIHPVLAIERLDNGPSVGGAPPPASSSESSAVAGDEPAATTGVVPSASSPGSRTPTARCRDATYSYAKSHSGACSRHGGVAEWFR